MIAKVQEKLKQLDIYGQQVSLSFRQEDQYKTSFGGFISLVILATVISFFYKNIIDFFAMTSVSSTTEFTFSSDPSLVQLDKDNYMWAVQIDQTNFTGNPFFNISVEQRHYKRLPNGTQIRLPNVYLDLVPCTLAHFQRVFDRYNQNFTDEYAKQSLNNFLCPNLRDESSTRFLVGGAWSSSDYYFLKFSVTNCQEATDNKFTWKPKCKSKKEIADALASWGSFRFQLFTTNVLINPDQPKNYIQPYLAIDQFYTFVPDGMFVQSDIFVRAKNVQTDKGILMYPDQEVEVLGFRELGDMRYQFEINRVTPNYYAAFYLNRSPYSYDIKRQFLRLDQLLSYLGGFVQFMIVVMGILVQFYNRQHFIISMANDLYEFNKDPNLGGKQYISGLLQSTMAARQMLRSQNNIQGRKYDSISQIRQLKPFASKPEMNQVSTGVLAHDKELKSPPVKKNRASVLKEKFSEYFEKFKNYMKQEKGIGLSLRMIFSVVFPIDSIMDDECFLIQKAIEQVKKELDIGFIINKLHEVTKLKTVLFNESQETLFNFSHKPLITLISTKTHNKERRSTKQGSSKCRGWFPS